MNSLQTPVAEAAVACLRVLHCLLQDEEVTLAQLSYLIENVHDPLAHVCLPPSQRPTAVPALQLSSPSASALNRYSSPGKHAHSSARSTMAAAAANEVKARRLPPQPAVVETAAPAQKEATPPKTAKSTERMHQTSKKASRTGEVNATASPSSTSRAEARVPLTLSRYWAIFANLPTLYTVHLTLVQQLDKVLLRLTQIVDELHPATQDTENGGVLHSSAAMPVPDAALNTCKDVSALRNPSASPAAGARSVYNEIGAMVCEFFGSDLMKHFMAEHMMYTVKYTQQGAPQLLRLSRLWRWCAEPSGSSGVSAASLTHLSEMDRKMILENDLFLDFLWRSFGPSGIPADDRVCIPASMELKQCTAAGGQDQALSRARALAGGSGVTRRSRSTAAASSPAARLPPIPAMWEGFHTLLVLLATPLSILRRYSHVARCLVESGALLPNDRKRLQSCFVNVAALRISEETNLVMEELCLHDVRGIMALMDIPGASTNSGGAGVEPINTGAVPALSSTGAPANRSNRVLIHYGRLLKRFERGRHERLIFLFSDWMCYAQESSNGRFRVRGTIPLAGLRVVEACDNPSMDMVNCFELVAPSLSKRITLYAASPEQRDQWVDAIRYTVRRFEGQRQRQAATNGSAHNSNTNMAAGDGGMPSAMRPTAPILIPKSRLSRQRHNDIKWQAYGNLQRRTAEIAPQPLHMISGAARVPLPATAGGPVGGSSSFPVCHSPPPANVPSGDPSPNNSAVRQRSRSTHWHLDYSVKSWSARTSVHRRIRSQELIAVHQQKLAASSSHIATPTKTDGAPPGGGGATVESNSNLGPIVVHSLDTGNMDSTSPVREADRNAPLQRQHSRQALSPVTSTAAVAASAERRSSSSLHAFTIDIIVSSNRGGGGSGVSTPLRRPVSERFEAANISSRGGNTPHQPPQETFAPPEKVARHPGGRRVASPPSSLESSSSSSSGVLDNVIGRAGPPALVTDGVPASGAPPSASAGAQAWSRADSGPPSKSIVSAAEIPPTSPMVVEENNSGDSRPITAGDQSASGTGSVMSAAAPLEESVDGGAEEDDSVTATAVVTAFRTPGVIYHRLMTPTSPLVMKSRPAAVPRENSDVPSPFRPIRNSSTGFDANVRKTTVAAVPLQKTVVPRHVDPMKKVPHGGNSDDGPVQP
ncbi:conserved hypothetical protein [Leishmania major strain Friedlin]|uniref:PH domain-containing protein n=1 Tax=Leishmania major TaxID=5664 RepID=Q4QHW1_LEIMA|nr:conserved hypothetical protein [Leishmania major strain Friedlin]CAG9569678.1 PH_domain_containing_protein_-__putative [Leishmania major strain Friedlin]CAJ02613.1 conserved hypothetical protein [Leishmania major strain Friedlin]|eukprot:XP_001681237.1 conserved hypothetical protein [Leishmania major strain Friedlin]